MNDQILEQIICETNRYHAQVDVNKPPKQKWNELTKEELKAFFGVVIAMGIIEIPDINYYWRTGSIFEMNWFPGIIKQDRFKQILRFLHFTFGR